MPQRNGRHRITHDTARSVMQFPGRWYLRACRCSLLILAPVVLILNVADGCPQAQPLQRQARCICIPDGVVMEELEASESRWTVHHLGVERVERGAGPDLAAENAARSKVGSSTGKAAVRHSPVRAAPPRPELPDARGVPRP